MNAKETRFLIIVSDFDISPLMLNIIRSFQVAQVNFEVIFLSDRQTWLMDKLEEIGIKGIIFSRPFGFKIPLLIARVTLILIRGKFSGVYLSGQIACLIGIAASTAARIPKRIFTRHHSDSNYAINEKSIRLFRARIFDRICNSLATTIVAVSPLVADLLQNREHVNSRKIKVISNSIPVMKVSRAQKHKSSSLFTIGVMSRHTEIKGLEYIVEAFGSFCRIYQDSFLIIVGEKSDSTVTILEKLAEIPDEKYSLINKTYDVSSFYNSLDVFVHVPIRKSAEAFGLVYLEALFSQVPCVFTESGILNGDNELKSLCTIVGYQNSAEILDSLVKHYENRNSIDNPSLSVLSRFSTDRMIESYSKLWNQIT